MITSLSLYSLYLVGHVHAISQTSLCYFSLTHSFWELKLRHICQKRKSPLTLLCCKTPHWVLASFSLGNNIKSIVIEATVLLTVFLCALVSLLIPPGNLLCHGYSEIPNSKTLALEYPHKSLTRNNCSRKIIRW